MLLFKITEIIVILLRTHLWLLQSPELNTILNLAHQCNNFTFHLIQHIDFQTEERKWSWRGDCGRLWHLNVYQFLSSFQYTNYFSSFSCLLVFLLYFLTLIDPHPLLQPHVSRLGKQHGMFLSFPWLLVPEPSERGSIPNVNVCCSLITTPLVGDEAGKQAVKHPPLFASFPLSLLALLFSLLVYVHFTFFLSLQPREQVCNPAESRRSVWRQKMSMCFNVLWKAASSLHWQ